MNDDRASARRRVRSRDEMTDECARDRLNQDVNSALRLRNCEPLYGFGAGTSDYEYLQTREDPEVFYVDEKELDMRALLTRKLPKPPIEVNLVPHWLAVEGVQPMIPENPMQTPLEPVPVEPPLGSKRPRATGVGAREDGADPDAGGLLPVVSHVLSRELQYYFDKVTGLIRGAGAVGASDENEEMLETALRSLSTDVGLHNLMPYFTQFITEETTQNLRDLPRLRVLIQMTRALISNPDINVELYLHQLMPSVVTCMVAKRLCKNVEEDHWSLRDDAANTVAFICAKFGAAYPSIQPRLTRTLLRALLDTKPLSTHYGAIKGLHALGPKVVRETVMPNLRAYLNTLEPLLEAPAPSDKKAFDAMSEEERNTTVAKEKLAHIRHRDAQRVMSALQDAVGACIRDEVGAAEDKAREARLADQLMRWHRAEDAEYFEKRTEGDAMETDRPAQPSPKTSPSRRAAKGRAKAAVKKEPEQSKKVVPKAAPLVRGRRTRRGTTPSDDLMGDATAAQVSNVDVSETHI